MIELASIKIVRRKKFKVSQILQSCKIFFTKNRFNYILVLNSFNKILANIYTKIINTLIEIKYIEILRRTCAKHVSHAEICTKNKFNNK